MRVACDIQNIRGKKTGYGFYLQNLLEGFEEFEHEIEWQFIDKVKKDFKKGDELKIVVSKKYELMQLDGLLAASGLAVYRVIVNQSQDYELVVAQAITKKIAA